MSGVFGGALIARGEAAGEARAAARRQGITRAVAADFPGLTARIEGEAVVIEGRGLLDRWLREATLRDIGRENGS